MELPKKYTVVVTCPACDEWIAFNEKSTRRKCRNIDCKSVVTRAQVKHQIKDELEKELANNS